MACSLSRVQIRLYRKAIVDTWKDIKGQTGIERAGKVLALLTALKQICNHHKVTLIFDEIQTGLGRTGKLLAEEHDGIVADLTLIGPPTGADLARLRASR